MLRRVCKVVLPVTLGCLFVKNAWAIDLLGIYQQALDNNYALKSNYSTYQSTDAAKDVSLGALFPDLSLTGTISNNDLDNSFANGNYQTSDWYVNFSQVLFDYGTYKVYKTSKMTALQAEATYRYQEQQFILNVAGAYFDVLYAKDELEFANANVDALKSALDQASVRFKVGIATDADVKQAEASYYNGLADKVGAENNLEKAYYTLYQYTGRVDKDLVPLSKSAKYKAPVPNNIDYWVKQAVANNQNYAAAQYLERSTYENYQSKKGLFLPTVYLVGVYSNLNSRGDALAYGQAGLSRHLESGYVGLSLSWNIFNGGTDYATEVQAARQYTAQEFTTLETYRSVIQNTRTDYISIAAFISKISALKQSVIAAKASYEQFVEQYNVGTATMTDVLDQLQKLFESKSQLSQAKYNYFNGLLKLKLDAGSLSVEDIKEINKELQLT
ncbi:TolC family outer membrane protein [Thiotrichales bacterium 19S9-12]|nr:TolC family outer membrane protein [Thiotrichales bacterium 19S9-11]MCF6812447.1 TolC family outer membrane protein [Thiotrichales bacterium 19S9-12]